MGSLMGGPSLTKVPAPQSLFPGFQQSYMNMLQDSGITGTSLNSVKGMAQTGMPTNVGPAFDAYKASMQNTIDKGATNLREQFGGMGLSGGSDMLKAGADYESLAVSQENNTLAQWAQQAQEAAANRQLSASEFGMGTAETPALAFAPSAVVNNSQGMLGGLLQSFSTLFPNFDLGAGGGLGGVFSGAGAAAADVGASYAVDPELALALAGL